MLRGGGISSRINQFTLFNIYMTPIKQLKSEAERERERERERE
jgi:hypothetical protein